jgi:hypothetical protein
MITVVKIDRAEQLLTICAWCEGVTPHHQAISQALGAIGWEVSDGICRGCMMRLAAEPATGTGRKPNPYPGEDPGTAGEAGVGVWPPVTPEEEARQVLREACDRLAIRQSHGAGPQQPRFASIEVLRHEFAQADFSTWEI